MNSQEEKDAPAVVEVVLKIGETVCIGPDVRVRFNDRRGKLVRLGVTAPKEAPILRAELL